MISPIIKEKNMTISSIYATSNKLDMVKSSNHAYRYQPQSANRYLKRLAACWLTNKDTVKKNVKSSVSSIPPPMAIYTVLRLDSTSAKLV